MTTMTAVANDDPDDLAKAMRDAWLDVPAKYGTNRRWEDIDNQIREGWRRVARVALDRWDNRDG